MFLSFFINIFKNEGSLDNYEILSILSVKNVNQIYHLVVMKLDVNKIQIEKYGVHGDQAVYGIKD